MSSIKFENPVPPENAALLLERIREVLGEPAAHDGQHFLFDGPHVYGDHPGAKIRRAHATTGEPLTSGKVLFAIQPGGCPVKIQPHAEDEIVELRNGKYRRSGDKWVKHIAQ